MNAPAGTAHPAPHRGKVSGSALAFGLCAAPLAWATQLVAGYAVTGVRCSAARMAIGDATLHTALAALDTGALALALAAFVVAWQSWRATRAEAGGSAHQLVDAGEGRTRFLAVWGMMASAGFLLTLVFATLGTVVVFPSCG